jgi:hypothetical protein
VLAAISIVSLTDLLLIFAWTKNLGELCADRLLDATYNWMNNTSRSILEASVWIVTVCALHIIGADEHLPLSVLIIISCLSGLCFAFVREVFFHQTQSALTEKVVYSSKVKFTSQGRYWRIGNKYYDLTDFADSGRHPGGRDILYLARDRFPDSTYAFEAHHTDVPKVRGMLAKMEVKGIVPQQPDDPQMRLPDLSPETSFYSVLRARMHEHLKANGGPGPTKECLQLWWISLSVVFFFSMATLVDWLVLDDSPMRVMLCRPWRIWTQLGASTKIPIICLCLGCMWILQ